MWTPLIHRVLTGVAIVTALVCPCTGFAFSIDGVEVQPGGKITPLDSVVLQVEITTPGMPAFLFQPTEVRFLEDGILVDVFVDTGLLTALDYLREDVSLGRLPAASYPYHVHLAPGYFAGWGIRDVKGSFVVVPEPDLNADGLVDARDLGMIRGAFGGNRSGDTDGDGTTDARDLAVLRTSFGRSVAPTPEPATLWLCLCFVGVLLAVRRHGA